MSMLAVTDNLVSCLESHLSFFMQNYWPNFKDQDFIMNSNIVELHKPKSVKFELSNI